MAQIHIEIDDSQVRHELDRLIEGPKLETYGRFEAMLVEASARTFITVHVETGSLKSTVHPDSHSEPYLWQGAVRAGGAAPGMPRDPAYYGVFELARGHKGGRNHHFYEAAHDYVPDETIATIMEFFAAGETGKIISTLSSKVKK